MGNGTETYWKLTVHEMVKEKLANAYMEMGPHDHKLGACKIMYNKVNTTR